VDRLFFKVPYREAVSTAVWLHAGTLIASVIYFRNELRNIILSVFSQRTERQLLKFLVIATLATFPVASLLLRLVLNLNMPDAALTIIIGVLLVGVYLTRRTIPQSSTGCGYLSSKGAVLTGLIQGLAAVPGISRSGVTITALLYQGADLRSALKVSYLMSIPVTAGAQLLLPLTGGVPNLSLSGLISLVTSATVGYATIRFLIRFSEKTDFMKGTLILGVSVILVGLALALI